MILLADDYQEHWKRTGKYGAGQQESSLVAAFRSLKGISSVIDVGCGMGRMRYLLSVAGLDVTYTGIDYDTTPLQFAQERFPDDTFIHAPIQQYQGVRNSADLVIATELLMHIRPRELSAVVSKLLRMAAVAVVSCDWSQPVPRGRQIAGHNWLHNYERAYGVHLETMLPAGPLQTVYIARP
jgi:trans-aconitate methyltransferase